MHVYMNTYILTAETRIAATCNAFELLQLEYVGAYDDTLTCIYIHLSVYDI